MIPFRDKSFDAVMFVDVLHHTNDPSVLLGEAGRVARTAVILKDHCRDGMLANSTLRFMDRVGNAHHGVVLPYNYWPEAQWRETFEKLALAPVSWNARTRPLRISILARVRSQAALHRAAATVSTVSKRPQPQIRRERRRLR